MPNASSIKVLIVDDRLTSRMLLRDGLQEIGITQIDMAPDGEAGLKAMMTKPAHLVISDFNMPKLDGIEFLRAIRAHAPTSQSGFIMLTGKDDSSLIKRAYQYGVNNYLTKPFTVEDLKMQIEGVVGPLT
jgi:two-component system, chemotaxis family, chemotaxis protein CheY